MRSASCVLGDGEAGRGGARASFFDYARLREVEELVVSRLSTRCIAVLNEWASSRCTVAREVDAHCTRWPLSCLLSSRSIVHSLCSRAQKLHD